MIAKIIIVCAVAAIILLIYVLCKAASMAEIYDSIDEEHKEGGG